MNNDILKTKNEYWILGKKYESLSEYILESQKIPWITYVVNFPPILNTDITNDVGWGCMIRTMQTMLCYTLIKHSESHKLNFTRNEIIKMFIDNTENPFSIHNICEVGSYLGTIPGKWFSPSISAYSLKLIVNEGPIPNIRVVVTNDINIPVDNIAELLESNNSVLLLVPIRLGIENINPLYYDFLRLLPKINEFVGIGGGKPKSSFYFYGMNTNGNMTYLDPHYTKEYIYTNMSNIETHNVLGLHEVEEILKTPIKQDTNIQYSQDNKHNNECNEYNENIEENYIYNGILDIKPENIDPSMVLCFYLDCKNINSEVNIDENKYEIKDKKVEIYKYINKFIDNINKTSFKLDKLYTEDLINISEDDKKNIDENIIMIDNDEWEMIK